MNTTINGTLEINHRNGSINFHTRTQVGEQAIVLLVSKLPRPIPHLPEHITTGTLIEVVHMFGAIYRIG